MAEIGMPYLHYLLRLWQSGVEEPVWRASLENPSTGERHAFPTLEALLRFLEAETGVITLREEAVGGDPEARHGSREGPAGSPGEPPRKE